MTDTYHRRREQGLCGRCGLEESGDLSVCEECRVKNVKCIRARMQHNRSQGLCSYCGKATLPNRTQCAKCIKIHGVKNYHKLIKRGRCGRCTRCNTNGFVICDICRTSSSKIQATLRNKRREQHLCLDCGGATQTFMRCDPCRGRRNSNKRR